MRPRAETGTRWSGEAPAHQGRPSGAHFAHGPLLAGLSLRLGSVGPGGQLALSRATLQEDEGTGGPLLAAAMLCLGRRVHMEARISSKWQDRGGSGWAPCDGCGGLCVHSIAKPAGDEGSAQRGGAGDGDSAQRRGAGDGGSDQRRGAGDGGSAQRGGTIVTASTGGPCSTWLLGL